MIDNLRCLACPQLVALLLLLCTSAHARAAQADDQLFENSIRPVLVETCFRCHGDATVKVSANLRVDSRDALLAGGDSGPAVVPGKPEESLLIHAIERSSDVSPMPPEKEKALREVQVAAFTKWIAAGAHWPAKSVPFVSARHWAFTPVDARPHPSDDAHDSTTSPIDRFIKAKQIAGGVDATKPADKRTLIRRATFDLTGLPPTYAEVEAFENDSSPAALAKLVDRLLESPHYGERWGRHWLDVVRYADTAGETADYPVPQAWRYRNYVISAFNNDKPYDQFLQEQIAGDVLANSSPDERYAERVTATGYLSLSRRFGFDSENYHHLTIQDTLDTLGQSVLGLSLGCARCHDHKFDPISVQDYYALYGIFDSSRYAFPGSEQKQKMRTLAPLVPLSNAIPKWRSFDRRTAFVAATLERQKQPVPAAILRSLHDIDGDFELQAPAAGGSNGVLVPPWLYEGKIAVTAAAQSPFKNFYARGKVGASITAGAGPYRIAQAIYPNRTAANCSKLYVNLDFRVATGEQVSRAAHGFWLGAYPDSPAVRLAISSSNVSIEQPSGLQPLAPVQPGEWNNLQLCFDIATRKVSGMVATTRASNTFEKQDLAADWTGCIDLVMLKPAAATDLNNLPAIEFDNLGIQEEPLAAPTIEMFTEVESESTAELDISAIQTQAELNQQLQNLVGLGGDFELQKIDSAPASPWNPGPGSVVAVSTRSQSPFQNLMAAGELGIHMPNRAAYDGFGVSIPKAWKPATTAQLFASFDFRCPDTSAGGDGSWRFYIGHGPGPSAAVELFLNGHSLFQRSQDARTPVASVEIGKWYQVQLKLDLNAKKYDGVLASDNGRHAFAGDFATGWDGAVDYSFIDSYGHIGGVRPAIDIDNYVLGETSLAEFGSLLSQAEVDAQTAARSKALQLRLQLDQIEKDLLRQAEELNASLVNGPFEMAYAMAEGTPHDARIQLRGEPEQLGESVPRGFIRVLGGGRLPTETRGSGRLELARWLTRADNPLTARVMVNRIWQYHFGRGLVRTPNDFGVRGLPPTHPDLLDYLAVEFIKNGWSVKRMHRLIMLSEAYQQSSTDDALPTEQAVDENAIALYARFARRRLSAEEIRDSILAVSGQIDREPAQAHPFPSPLNWGYTQHGPFNAIYEHNKRSVYLMTQRLKRHPFLALFDGADPNATTADRLATTVPTQALYFLNDAFIHDKAAAWATSSSLAADADAPHSDGARPEANWIALAYKTALARVPTDDEVQEAEVFLAGYRGELSTSSGIASSDANARQNARAAFLRALMGCNEFLHVD